MANWIETRNPFGLEKPPQWWLTRLHDQDSQLVVFPSVLRHVYILARRRNQTKRMPALDRLDKELLRTSAYGDGDILSQNDLIYVDTMMQSPITGWSTRTFEELKSRDIWSAGGGDAYTDRIEAQEAAKELAKRQKMVADIEHRAADAYRSYQARTGQRTKVGPGLSPRRPTFVPAGRL